MTEAATSSIKWKRRGFLFDALCAAIACTVLLILLLDVTGRFGLGSPAATGEALAVRSDGIFE